VVPNSSSNSGFIPKISKLPGGKPLAAQMVVHTTKGEK